MADRYIPSDIKRLVRQKCCFGCVICGCPIFQYDHVDEFHRVQEHRVENLLLLCGTHHDQKSRRQLSADAIRLFGDTPFNRRRNFTTGALAGIFTGDEGRLVAGHSIFEFRFDRDGEGVAISVDDLPVLSFSKDGRALLLNLWLFERGIGTVLKIVRGEMVVNTGVWDYRFEGKLLRIWSDRMDRAIVLEFNDNGVHLERGIFKGKHHTVTADPNGISIAPTGQRFVGLRILNGGLQVGGSGNPMGVSIGRY